MKFFGTLRNALAAHFIFATTFPLVILGTASLLFFYNHIREDIAKKEVYLAYHISEDAHRYLATPLEQIRDLRNSLFTRSRLQENSSIEILLKEKGDFPSFEAIFLLDAQGKIVRSAFLPSYATSLKSPETVKQFVEELFGKYPKPRSPVWMDVFISPLSGNEAIGLEISAGEGTLLGILSLDHFVAHLHGKDEALGNIAFAIIDRTGRTIVQSSGGKAFDMSDHPELFADNVPYGETLIRIHSQSTLMESALLMNETGWTIWVGQEMAGVLGPARHVFNAFLACIILALCIGIAVALVMSRKLTSPLRVLMRQAREVSEGRYDLSFDRCDYREVDELAQAFAAMTTAVRERKGALTQSRARFINLVESIDGIVWEADTDLRFIYVSRRSKDILGFTVDEWLEDPAFWSHHIHPDDRDQALSYCREKFCKGVDHDFEYRMIAKDGRILWIRDVVSVVKAGGTPVRMLGVMFDVTKKKEMELALIENEKRYRNLSLQFQTILDGISDILLLVSADKKIVWGNRGAAAAFNLSVDRLAGKSCPDLWGMKTDACEEFFEKTFERGELCEDVVKTSEKKSFEIKTFPIRENGGAVQNVIVYARDLTEKIELREQAARAAHLAALGELSAGIAHEINNPTGLMLLELPILQNFISVVLPILDEYSAAHGDFDCGGLPYSRIRGNVVEMISDLNEGARRIKYIVDELKDFSRPLGSTAEEEVDLNLVVEKTLKLVSNALKKATDDFRLSLCQKPLMVGGHFHRIEQVVVNILLNACQALPDRTKGISLSTYFDVDRKRNVIEVRDEGKGIAPEHLPHVTDPFFTTRRDAGGTGLGLSVSSRIVEEHGGRIRFISEPGRGTTVLVEFPPLEEGA